MANQKGMLFLGCGATAGSRIKKNGYALPTDSQFFESPLVTGLLGDWNYPALSLVRKLKPFQGQSGLYQTWNDLFIYRGLAQAGIIREDRSKIDELYHLANHDWRDGYEWRAKHYQHQFEIREASIPPEYYLAELGIWDLRVLVKDVYSRIDLRDEVYRALWTGLKKKVEVAAVVNLNYDTTFDDVLHGDFYCPGDSNPAKGKIPKIRPHGSLKWTSRGTFKTGGGFQDWTHSMSGTCLKDLGYRKTDDPSVLELLQPLIVPPAEFKEEVVGSSSIPGLTNPILRQQWLVLEHSLRESNHWIFIGFSFASGDDHLVFLLKRLYDSDKQIHCSCYHRNHVCNTLRDIFGQHANVCGHDIPKHETIDSFLPREGCPLST